MSGISSSISSPLLKTPQSIVNYSSAGGQAGYLLVPNIGKQVLSGALTAGTLATMLTVTGGGVLTFAAVRTQDATARTVRLQIIMDGVTVFDSTSASISTSGFGFIAVGFNVDTTSGTATASAGPEAMPFSSSLVIKIASSISETDKIAVLYSYYTVA